MCLCARHRERACAGGRASRGRATRHDPRRVRCCDPGRDSAARGRCGDAGGGRHAGHGDRGVPGRGGAAARADCGHESVTQQAWTRARCKAVQTAGLDIVWTFGRSALARRLVLNSPRFTRNPNICDQRSLEELLHLDACTKCMHTLKLQATHARLTCLMPACLPTLGAKTDSTTQRNRTTGHLPRP